MAPNTPICAISTTRILNRFAPTYGSLLLTRLCSPSAHDYGTGVYVVAFRLHSPRIDLPGHKLIFNIRNYERPKPQDIPHFIKGALEWSCLKYVAPAEALCVGTMPTHWHDAYIAPIHIALQLEHWLFTSHQTIQSSII